MKKKMDFMIKFWGVRGSHPVPGEETLKFGGNTPCVQVQIGEHLVILDAGTGICNLGQKLADNRSFENVRGDILITHTHWDHIQGFPFFKPAFKEGNFFTLYGPKREEKSFAQLMSEQMSSSYFPISLKEMGAEIKFKEIKEQEVINLGDNIRIKSFENKHPGRAISFRIEHEGRCCCYITDIEHSKKLAPQLIDFVCEADLLIYDAAYTDEEYLGLNGFQSKVGWGHSTWQEAIKLAQAAKVDKLILFHHNVERSDKDLEQIEKKAKKRYKNTFAAREGMVIHL